MYVILKVLRITCFRGVLRRTLRGPLFISSQSTTKDARNFKSASVKWRHLIICTKASLLIEFITRMFCASSIRVQCNLLNMEKSEDYKENSNYSASSNHAVKISAGHKVYFCDRYNQAIYLSSTDLHIPLYGPCHLLQYLKVVFNSLRPHFQLQLHFYARYKFLFASFL